MIESGINNFKSKQICTYYTFLHEMEKRIANRTTNSKYRNSTKQPIEMNHLLIGFIILIIGYVISFIILCTEKLYKI